MPIVSFLTVVSIASSRFSRTVVLGHPCKFFESGLSGDNDFADLN